MGNTINHSEQDLNGQAGMDTPEPELTKSSGPCYAVLLQDLKRNRQVFAAPTLPDAVQGMGELIKAALVEAGTNRFPSDRVPSVLEVRLFTSKQEGETVIVPKKKYLDQATLAIVKLSLFPNQYTFNLETKTGDL